MKITLQELTTRDLATLAQRIITTSESENYPFLINHPLLLVLKNSYSEYDTVYAKQTYSGKGAEVALADQERDMIFGNLKAFVNGYRKINSVPNYEYAEDLYQIFERFGLNIDGLSYSAETAQMVKLIEELDKPENLHKLAGLHLATAFNDLKTRQENFERLFSEQAQANANLRQTKSATSLRKHLEKTLKPYLNFVTTMKDTELWKDLYSELSELVKSAKNSKRN